MAEHHVTPDHYFTTMGSHPPVLRIAPGDTVHTTTVDASGRDASGNQITPRGNPQTGPFFIDGAEVGDTLVVHLDAIIPNRDYGWSGHNLAANVVDPNYVTELWRHDSNQAWEPVIWTIDKQAGTATLATPNGLMPLTLPLRPMLGCFGVAPAGGEAISTATSARHGGNMDYNGFVSGVTVYFPVLTEGALFFLGDGHALQGDGEISGTGVEISMDVSFSVDLIKNQHIGWPRGENETHIFTIGNARPLDQCVQHATTEMARWLQASYNIDAHSVGILMGQTVAYDLGNIFDPAYTMVCKMPKSLLKPIPHK